jgi:hypothetical protein
MSPRLAEDQIEAVIVQYHVESSYVCPSTGRRYSGGLAPQGHQHSVMIDEELRGPLVRGHARPGIPEQYAAEESNGQDLQGHSPATANTLPMHHAERHRLHEHGNESGPAKNPMSEHEAETTEYDFFSQWEQKGEQEQFSQIKRRDQLALESEADPAGARREQSQ